MAIDLKHCPFCGKNATVERVGDRRQSTIYSCDCCGCTLETGEEWDHGRDWNRRACGGCGGWIKDADAIGLKYGICPACHSAANAELKLTRTEPE